MAGLNQAETFMFSSMTEEKAAIQTIVNTYSMDRTLLSLNLNNVPHEVYLIPDVHGRNDLLQSALSKVSDHSAVIMLGDFADRGPDSLGVYETIFSFNKKRSEMGETGDCSPSQQISKQTILIYIEQRN